MVNYIYNAKGVVVGFWSGKYIYKIDGTPIGQLDGNHVHRISGQYVGELFKDMIVNKNLGSFGSIGSSGSPGSYGNPGNPGNRGSVNYGYPDVFDKLLWIKTLEFFLFS